MAAPAWGESPRRYALLYPALEGPEGELFRIIREGIATGIHRSDGLLLDHALARNATLETVAAILAADHPDVLITLGRGPTMLAQGVQPAIPWLTGAAELPVPLPPVGGISLIVNPDKVLATLHEIAPRIARFSLVIEPQRFGWLRPYLERSARARALHVLLYEASSVAEAASHYLNILRYGNPVTDSLWLLEQNQFVTADTLPRIVEDAWAREFLVFSSVLQHVSEGSLFALYLNANTLGPRLAELAIASRAQARPIAFDDAPLRAINVRTARHLSNIVDAAVIKSFDLTLGDS